jgi:HK97 gp10 family phage protein
MDFNFETPNLAAFEQRLLELGTTTARKLARQAVRQGANVILFEARRLVAAGHPAFPNKVTGLMAKSLVTRDHGLIGDNIVFSIDVKAAAFYARFVEFGTSHAQPYPFMRPAAESKAAEAVQQIVDVMGPGIEQAWGAKL